MNRIKLSKKIISHLKQTGFVFQGSEIYGGLANTWDYGHLGVLLKNNIAEQWKKFFISYNENSFFLDAKILMNPNVWVASGHISSFSDPLIENKINKKRYRADHLIKKFDSTLISEEMSNEEMENWIRSNIKKYDNTKTEWSRIKNFNLMFETSQGVIEEKKNLIYLRPETAQAIFVNFKNYNRFYRALVPFGIGQIGKAFRNEVTPGNFIFRTREFEQMELEYFVHPDKSDEEFDRLVEHTFSFAKYVGLDEKRIRKKPHSIEQLSHYSKATTDVEFDFSFGWGELMGIANRTDFDLKTHSQHSNEDLIYHDLQTNEKYYPYVIEPSIGLDRLMYAVLENSFIEEKINENNKRLVLKIDKKIVPYQIAILPLTKKLSQEAKVIFNDILRSDFRVIFDQTASIGKRYRRQDAIGTYLALTFDFDSLEDSKVTIRYRDSMAQKRIKIKELKRFLKEEFSV